MRRRQPLAFAGLFVVVIGAILGFASFTARAPQPVAPGTDQGADVSNVSGRLTAAVLSSRLHDSVPDSPAARTGEVSTARSSSRSPVSSSTPEPASTSDERAAATGTTVTPPPPAPPTPTTTTSPPPPPPTLPPVTSPPNVFPPDVERWRPLVATYFPDALLDQALSVMECESKGDPEAENPSSTASGLYQFIASTWNWASANAGFSGVSVFDPEANIATAAFLVEYSVDRGLPAWQHWVCQPDVGS